MYGFDPSRNNVGFLDHLVRHHGHHGDIGFGLGINGENHVTHAGYLPISGF